MDNSMDNLNTENREEIKLEPLKIDKKYFDKPYIAYPTLLICLLGYIFWGGAIYLRIVKNYNPLYTLPLSILGIYTLFTPLHDSTHGSISTNTKYNEIVGYISGFPFFFAPYKSFQFVHLRHHAYTNIKGKDPDLYSGQGNKWILPLKWLTQVGNYYYYFLKIMFSSCRGNCENKIKDATKDLGSFCEFTNSELLRNNSKVFLLSIGGILINIFLTLYIHSLGYFYDIFYLWILPSSLGIALLSFLFDFLTHRPHTFTRNKNKYKTTNMTEGFFTKTDKGDGNDIISLLTCNQLTYHNIHHLYPKIPFYNYHKVWLNYKEELINRGNPVKTIF